MTRLFLLTNTLVMMILFTVTIVDGFNTLVGPTIRTSHSTKTSLHAARTKASVLLDEALDAYPYRFKPENKRGMVTREKATVAFNELARLYGDENALAIVKLEPRALVFNSDNYAPCIEAWTEQFGLEASQGMVGRNPGLLAVKPKQAQKPAEDSMVFSYIIAVTRPLPKLIGVGLLLSILTSGMQ